MNLTKLKYKVSFPGIIAAIICLLPMVGVTQELITDEESFDKLYAQNIKKSRINGVYIPVDLEDAFTELKGLSTEEALEKFKSGEEDVVAKKLHFGIGRWMIYNWNFYEGSRFSHYLKEIGINHPDDQAKFVIVCFHRKLNGKPLKIEEQVQYFQELRQKLREEKLNNSKLIKEETKIRSKDG